MYLNDREDRRGHPVEMPSKRRGTNYSVYLDEEQLKVLEDIRWRERKSMSAIVRKAIEEYIKNHAEGNSTFKLDKWQEDPNFVALPTLLASKEKWIECIDSCSDSELTNIGIMSNTIHNLVKMRRTKEYKEKIRIETKRI